MLFLLEILKAVKNAFGEPYLYARNFRDAFFEAFRKSRTRKLFFFFSKIDVTRKFRKRKSDSNRISLRNSLKARYFSNLLRDKRRFRVGTNFSKFQSSFSEKSWKISGIFKTYSPLMTTTKATMVESHVAEPCEVILFLFYLVTTSCRIIVLFTMW